VLLTVVAGDMRHVGFLGGRIHRVAHGADQLKDLRSIGFEGLFLGREWRGRRGENHEECSMHAHG
jgi:hypothetical protein